VIARRSVLGGFQLTGHDGTARQSVRRGARADLCLTSAGRLIAASRRLVDEHRERCGEAVQRVAATDGAQLAGREEAGEWDAVE